MAPKPKIANCGYGEAAAGVGRKLLEYWGPNLRVSIGLDAAWTKTQNRAPKYDKTDLKALVDTGAEDCCIDSALAAEIRLPLINQRPVGGVGAIIADVFNAQVHIPELRYTIHGPFAAIPDLADRIHYPIVLGRTFLRDCRLVYFGPTGEATLEVSRELSQVSYRP